MEWLWRVGRPTAVDSLSVTDGGGDGLVHLDKEDSTRVNINIIHYATGKQVLPQCRSQQELEARQIAHPSVPSIRFR
jgi:hypothetical protein